MSPEDAGDLRFARLQELFAAAIELTGDARAKFIGEVAAEDAALARDLAELMRIHADGDARLVQGVRAAANAASAELIAEGRPERIGPYAILRVLGEGGMGTVYLAEQSVPVRRLVALKLIKLGMDSRAVVARFEQERQALALMEHHGIAKVYDCGTSERGQPFFVMELVAGVPLHRYCREHRLPLEQRLELMMQVCAAVQHAHQKGVVHRDLKPGNVLVVEVDGRPQAKVIDFGLAKSFGEVARSQSLATMAGDFLGTPSYMAPEQGDPQNPDIDTRADVYSLGVMLYELLTDSVPFEPGDLRRSALAAWFRDVAGREPQRPSARVLTIGAAAIATGMRSSAGVLLRALRTDLDWVVLRAIEKERGRRYASASALADDLQHYLDGKAVDAGPPSASYRLRKIVRRHRRGLAAALAIAVVASALGGAYLVQLGRTLSLSSENRQLRTDSALASAHALADVADWQAAEDAFALARDFGADPVEVEIGLAEVWDSSFRGPKARAALEALLVRPDLGRRRATVELLRADPSLLLATDVARLDTVRRALDSGDLDPADAGYARAILASSLAEARGHLEGVLQLRRFHRRANEMLLAVTVLSEEPERGLAAASESLAIYPGDPVGAFCKALCLQRLGFADQARELLGRPGMPAVARQRFENLVGIAAAVAEYADALAREDRLTLVDTSYRTSSFFGLKVLAAAGSRLMPMLRGEGSGDEELHFRLPPRSLELARNAGLAAMNPLRSAADKIEALDAAAAALPQAGFHFMRAMQLAHVDRNDEVVQALAAAATSPDLLGVRQAAKILHANWSVHRWMKGVIDAKPDEALRVEAQAEIDDLVRAGITDSLEFHFVAKLSSLLRDPGRCAAAAAQWAAAFPDQPEPHAYLAESLRMMGSPRAALEYITPWKQQFPDNERIEWATDNARNGVARADAATEAAATKGK